MDEPGQKAAAEVAELFEPGKVYLVKMTHKDANEYLKKNEYDLFKKHWWDAVAVEPDGIVDSETMWDLVSSETSYDIIPWPWNAMNKMTYGFRLGEMVTITAGSGMGKTQLLREIQHFLIKNTDYHLGGLMMEETLRDSGIGVMAIEAEQPLHLPTRKQVEELEERFPGVFNDVRCIDIDPAVKKAAFDATLGTGRLHFYDSFGSNNVDKIVNKVRYLAKSKDCKIIFLDHISILVSDQQHGDERKALDEIATKLKTLTIELNIALIMVSHAKRQTSKPLEEGGNTSLADIRGTAGIGQLSNTVLGLERDGQDPSAIRSNTTTVRVIKNRFAGTTGVSSLLYYDLDTGRMSEETEETLDMKEEFHTDD